MRPISKVKAPGKLPRRLLFLSCESWQDHWKKKPTRTAHTLRVGFLSKWLWSEINRSDAEPRKRFGEGTSYNKRGATRIGCTSELYSSIIDGTSKRYQTWLFMDNSARTCQLTGLFDLIKDGRLVIDSRQIPTPDDPDGEFWAEKSSSLFVVSDPPTIMGLRTDKGARLIVVDIGNYFSKPLSVLAEQIGFPLLTCNDVGKSDSLAEHRVKRRVEVIEKLTLGLLGWIEREDLGSLKYTAAGQAYAGWRRKFQPTEIWNHSDEYVRRLERAGYYGGEFRAFRFGTVNEPCWQLDVNSLYPSVMYGGEFPCDFKAWTGACKWKGGPPPGDPLGLLSEVWIRSMSESYPKRIDGRVCYVRGSFPTLLCGEELQGAISRGDVIGHRMYARYRTYPLFSECVQDWYLKRLAYREDGDKVYEMLCKMMLNSLYGKFAQLATDLAPRTDFEAPVQWGRWQTISLSTGKRRIFRCLDHKPFEEVSRKEIVKTFPAISAWITAAAREKMRGIIKVAGEQNCVYQAVDSLIVTRIGLDRLERAKLISNDSLGGMKIQREAPSAFVRGWGDYQIGDHRVLVGRKQDALERANGDFRQTINQAAKGLIFEPPSTTSIEKLIDIKRAAANPRGKVDSGGRVRPEVAAESLPDELVNYLARRQHVFSDEVDQCL